MRRLKAERGRLMRDGKEMDTFRIDVRYAMMNIILNSTQKQ